MIILEKLNGEEFTINSDYIEKIIENPDTTITLTNGNVYITKDTMRQVILKCIAYKNQVFKDCIRID